jgi:hypothetical protein
LALPKNMETPRGLELQAKLNASPANMTDWPMPTKDDYVLLGGIVVLFSYAEFQLRRLAEAFDYAGMLPDQWKGKAASLSIGKVEEAVAATPVWADGDLAALRELYGFRPLRNLVAHFIVRRFPNDAAFVFMTKSVKDYKNVFGAEPGLGVAMTAIVEREPLVQILKRIEHIQNWLARVAPDFEKRLLPALALSTGRPKPPEQI